MIALGTNIDLSTHTPPPKGEWKENENSEGKFEKVPWASGKNMYCV